MKVLVALILALSLAGCAGAETAGEVDLGDPITEVEESVEYVPSDDEYSIEGDKHYLNDLLFVTFKKQPTDDEKLEFEAYFEGKFVGELGGALQFRLDERYGIDDLKELASKIKSERDDVEYVSWWEI